MRETLPKYLQPHVLVIDEVGYLTYGPDAANVLFHVVNDRHLRKRPIIFTTNKSPLTAWGDVLHDHDLAEAIVDRTLERGRLLVLDGPSHRTLDSKAVQAHLKPDKISGKPRTKFPEPPRVKSGERRRCAPRSAAGTAWNRSGFRVTDLSCDLHERPDATRETLACRPQRDLTPLPQQLAPSVRICGYRQPNHR